MIIEDRTKDKEDGSKRESVGRWTTRNMFNTKRNDWSSRQVKKRKDLVQQDTRIEIGTIQKEPKSSKGYQFL